MRLRAMILTLLACSWLSLSGCLPPRSICQCEQTEKELRAYTLKYADALEDLGNLRQELKVCQQGRR